MPLLFHKWHKPLSEYLMWLILINIDQWSLFMIILLFSLYAVWGWAVLLTFKRHMLPSSLESTLYLWDISNTTHIQTVKKPNNEPLWNPQISNSSLRFSVILHNVCKKVSGVEVLQNLKSLNKTTHAHNVAKPDSLLRSFVTTMLEAIKWLEWWSSEWQILKVSERLKSTALMTETPKHEMVTQFLSHLGQHLT